MVVPHASTTTDDEVVLHLRNAFFHLSPLQICLILAAGDPLPQLKRREAEHARSTNQVDKHEQLASVAEVFGLLISESGHGDGRVIYAVKPAEVSGDAKSNGSQEGQPQ